MLEPPGIARGTQSLPDGVDVFGPSTRDSLPSAEMARSRVARAEFLAPVRRRDPGTLKARKRLTGTTVEAYPGSPWDEASKDVAKRRAVRWELMRWQWAHSSLKRCRHCRLYSTGAGWVALRRSANGAYLEGLQTCGSIWACPVCSAIIRTRRAQLIEESARAWVEQDGRWLAFLTLTVRHSRGQSLEDTYCGLARAWKLLRQGRWWRGLGFDGFWRSSEVTYGAANGWHPHLHLLVFGSGPERDLGVIGRQLGERWQAAVVRSGLEPTSLSRGSRLQAVSVGAGGLGDYLSKVLDDGQSWGVGSELAMADRKRAKGGRYSPMDLLAGASAGERWASARWHEYEQTTNGRRAIESSRGLRELTGVEDRADEDLVSEVEDGEAIALIPAGSYRRLAHAGFVPDVLEVAERGEDGQTLDFIAAVLRLVGGEGPYLP